MFFRPIYLAELTTQQSIAMVHIFLTSHILIALLTARLLLVHALALYSPYHDGNPITKNSKISLLLMNKCLFMGGKALYGFSITLFAGVVTGTWLSVTIASTVQSCLDYTLSIINLNLI
ncbi:hypothetical protein CTM84_20500 [Photobacterium kishitanii]|nr:hypothetical protein CTM84_20500 [Photobacterium kishitanii]